MLCTWGVPMQKPAEPNLRAIPEPSRQDDAQDDAYQDHVSLNSPRWNDIYEVFRPLYMAHDTRKVVLLLRSHYGFRTTESICNKKIKQWREQNLLPPKYQTARRLDKPTQIQDLIAPVVIGVGRSYLAVSNSIQRSSLITGDDPSEARVLTQLWLVETLLQETCGQRFPNEVSFEGLLESLENKRAASSIRKYVQNVQIPTKPAKESQLSIAVFNAQRWLDKLVSYTCWYIQGLKPIEKSVGCSQSSGVDTRQGRLTHRIVDEPFDWQSDDPVDLAHTICRGMPHLLGTGKPSQSVYEEVKSVAGAKLREPAHWQVVGYDEKVQSTLMKLEELKTILWEQAVVILSKSDGCQLETNSRLKWSLRITLQLIAIYAYDPKASSSKAVLQAICQKLALGCQKLNLIVLEEIWEPPDGDEDIEVQSSIFGRGDSKMLMSDPSRTDHTGSRRRETPFELQCFCCCQCGDGPATRALHARCISCSHDVCIDCV